MSIEIERWIIQEEMNKTRNNLFDYQKVMFLHLNEYIRLIVPSNFEGKVNEIIDKMMANDESDRSTVGNSTISSVYE